MSVRFRNLSTDPEDDVESWPYEAIVTAIERGTIGDWVRLTTAIGHDPWGEVAAQVAEHVADAAPYGVGPLLERAIDRARRQAHQDERRRVAAEVADLVERSGLTLGELARRVGTSGPRLSTYRSGRVVPSATMMLRLRDAVDGRAPRTG